MANRPTLTTLPSGARYDTTTLNANFDALVVAFDNLIGRSGTSGDNNTATGDLDLNGKTLRNFVFPGAIVGINWRGAWVTATAYAVNDVVQQNGNAYICTVAHTSGTFATDLAVPKWELFVSKGASGAGSGDLVSTNNLSDVSNAATSRTNLGLAIGSNVQAYDAKLAAVAALTWSSNKLINITGAATATTLDFLTDGTLAANSDTAVPSQKAVKTYVDAAVSSGVTSITAGTGLSGGTITTTGTIALVTTTGAVGTFAWAISSSASILLFGSTVSGSSLKPCDSAGTHSQTALSGTWQCLGYTVANAGCCVAGPMLYQRIA